MGHFLQALAGEAIDFFEFVAGSFDNELVRKAIVKDLGGNPNAPAGNVFPATQMESVENYRKSSEPTTEAGLEALATIAERMESFHSVIEAWTHDGTLDVGAGVQQSAHALLDIFTTNYARLKYPRLFLVFQLMALLEDLGSTYGDEAWGSDNSLYRTGHAFVYLGEFLFAPGKQIEDLNSDAQVGVDYAARIVDAVVRLLAIVVAVLDKDDKVSLVQDVMTGWDGPPIEPTDQAPALADLISQRLTSIVLGAKHDDGTDTDTERLFITTTMVPKAEGGTAVFLALGGAVEIEESLGDLWKVAAKIRADAPVGIVVNVSDPGAGGALSADPFEFKLSFASQPPAPTDAKPSPVSFSFPSPTGTRLDIGQLALNLELSKDAAELLVSFKKAALVVDPHDLGAFIAELAGDRTLRLPFNLTLGPSSTRGFVLEGGLSEGGETEEKGAPLSNSGGGEVINAAIPLGKRIGPVTVHEVALRVRRPSTTTDEAKGRLDIEFDTSFSASIGPVYFRLDQLGLQIGTDSEAEKPNLGVIDLQLGMKFPKGIAVNVDTSLVHGGGSIIHDPDQGLYFGTLELAVEGGLMVKATALVTTKLPGGGSGFSLFIIVTVEFGEPPYALGMGFFLEGIGGMLALHRTFDETAMRAALPSGLLRQVLFPNDPIHHSTELLAAIQKLFPIRRGSHMFGLLAKIGWMHPALIRMEMGIILELGHQHRLILLGRVSALLPKPEAALIKLNMDSVGILDFDAGTFALDAVLYDSKLCDRFVLSGAMAMRMVFKGSAGFALSIGGLHPRFAAPPGFPSVARLQLALSTGQNPRLLCQCYFAVTSNTVQFGSECSLYAAALGFSIEGNVGFDVLIQLLPFHFLAEFRAGVQLKRGSHNLFKVSVSGELEGPIPLRISGRAKFEILWCDFSVSFDRTLVEGRTSDELPRIDVMAMLTSALAAPSSWEAALPADTGQLATVRASAEDGLLLHPLGTLTVRQTVVPLGLARDIDRIGGAIPTDARRFAITRFDLGTASLPVGPEAQVMEMFASGQYFDMTDDERLAAPSFEAMSAGIKLADEGYATDLAKKATSSFAYTDIVINADGTTVELPAPHEPDLADIWLMTQLSAAALARTRHSLSRRFAAPPLERAPKIKDLGWAAEHIAPGAEATAASGGEAISPVEADGRAPRRSWVEAHAEALATRKRVVTPEWELVG